MMKYFMIALVGFISVSVFAQETQPEQKKELVGAFSVFEPDVHYGDNQTLTGFGFELWEKVCKELGYTCAYKEVPQFTDLLSQVEQGKFEFAIAGISKTDKREEVMDFSEDYLESNQSILILSQENTWWGYVKVFCKQIFTFQLLLVFLVPILLGIICSAILVRLEKGNKEIPDKFFDKDPLKSGIDVAFRSFWEAMTTQGTGVAVPKSRLGYFFTYVLGFYKGTVINAIFVGGLVTIFMNISLDIRDSQIICLQDLRGKEVMTARGTTSEETLRILGAKVTLVDDINEAYDALLQGETTAVVFDKPNVLHFAKQKQNVDKVVVVEGDGAMENYGFAFPQGSPLREQVNRVLLKFRKDGTYDTLYRKWFGE